jgi:two-component system, NtrC family, sensor kinase
MTPREANADLLAEITALRDRVASLTRENTELQGALAQASDQQTATREILRVISSLPTDLEPVFDPIVRSVVRLCNGLFGTVFLYDGRLMTLAAVHNAPQEGVEAIRRIVPCPPSADLVAGRALLSRATVHVHDAVGDTESPAMAAVARAIGFRTCIAVPMLRDGQPIGALGVSRQEVQPFSETEIELLKTFADQAVIAIENVRMFKELGARNAELTQALDRQTATAEILRVISSSRTDLQPVFDTILQSAVRLCGASHGGVYRFDGELVHSVAHDGYTREQLEHWRGQWPQPVTAARPVCQAIRTRRLVRIADLATAAELRELPSETVVNLRARGARSFMAVPMFRQHDVIGALAFAHRDIDAFSDAHVELLKTFADQAVIAIENARLLNELQARTRELTRSVGELTALGDVGRALSSTLDLETVLQTIVTRANTLAGTAGCTIWDYDDAHEEFRLRVSHYADERDAAILGAPDRVTTIRRGQWGDDSGHGEATARPDCRHHRRRCLRESHPASAPGGGASRAARCAVDPGGEGYWRARRNA